MWIYLMLNLKKNPLCSLWFSANLGLEINSLLVFSNTSNISTEREFSMDQCQKCENNWLVSKVLNIGPFAWTQVKSVHLYAEQIKIMNSILFLKNDLLGRSVQFHRASCCYSYSISHYININLLSIIKINHKLLSEYFE